MGSSDGADDYSEGGDDLDSAENDPETDIADSVDNPEVDVTDGAEDLEAALFCGDGVADTGEECDGINLRWETCGSLGFGDEVPACDDLCHFNMFPCPGCGNGLCEAAEDQFVCPADCSAIAISAGSDHSCAVLIDGTARCWGLNERGSLGDGTTTDSNIPVAVVGLTGATASSAGANHTCALLSDETVMCWGSNYRGQLGARTSPEYSSVTLQVASW